MDAPFLQRHRCAKVGMDSIHLKEERSVRDEDYDNWDRFGKKRVSGAWRRRAWQGGVAQAAQAQGRGEVLRESRALPDRHGSLREGALLGQEALGVRPHGAPDGPAICEAVCEDEQE